MKKLLLGAIIGGLLIFAWQTVSWMVLDLHKSAHQYTEKQDEIMTFLSSHFTEDGSYSMPNVKPGASAEEHEALMKSATGKPWAMISYHKSWNMNMVTNIIRGLLTNILLVGLFCWILSKMATPKFGTIFIASLFAGLIVFTNGVYTQHIWYQSFDLMAHFLDYVVGWGLCGLWLGRVYSKK